MRLPPRKGFSHSSGLKQCTHKQTKRPKTIVQRGRERPPAPSPPPHVRNVNSFRLLQIRNRGPTQSAMMKAGNKIVCAAIPSARGSPICRGAQGELESRYGSATIPLEHGAGVGLIIIGHSGEFAPIHFPIIHFRREQKRSIIRKSEIAQKIPESAVAGLVISAVPSDAAIFFCQNPDASADK